MAQVGGAGASGRVSVSERVRAERRFRPWYRSWRFYIMALVTRPCTSTAGR